MIDFVFNNYDTIVSIVGAVIALLVVVVRITPTEKDDKVLDILKRGFTFFKENIKKEDIEKFTKKKEDVK